MSINNASFLKVGQIMDINKLTFKEAAEEASHKNIMANELDILVASARNMNKKRDRSLYRIAAVLTNVEKRLSS